jgi:hypothetical protein
MSGPERPRYTVETELEEAETAARDLPGQIARVREQVRKAHEDLAGGKAGQADSTSGKRT